MSKIDFTDIEPKCKEYGFTENPNCAGLYLKYPLKIDIYNHSFWNIKHRKGGYITREILDNFDLFMEKQK